MNAPADEPSSSASPGYAMPDPSYRAPRVHHTSHIRLFVIFVVSLAVVIAAVIGVRALVVKPVRQPVCPQDCHGPPKRPGKLLPSVRPGPPAPTGVLKSSARADRGVTAQTDARPGAMPGSVAHDDAARPQAAVRAGQPMVEAVAPFKLFDRLQATDSDGGFSFSYPDDNVGKDATSVSWHEGDNTVWLFGGLTDSTPRQIAQRVVRKVSANATLSYEIPNARVGYQSGYGEIDDFVPQNSSGTYDPQRVVVLVAVRNGVALVAAAAGPTYWPAQPEGHPSGAELSTIDNGTFYYWVNSFRWKDDPPR